MLFMLTAWFAAVACAASVKVACVGDSVTYGYKIAHRKTDSYPAQLQVMLGNNYQVENFGVSGATLLKNGHHPYYLTEAFKSAIGFRPDIVVIHLGLNDTDPRDWPDYGDHFRADYSWLIAQFRQANPAVRVYICILTPIFEWHPRFKSSTHTWADEIRNEIPQIAAANHTSVIDLYTPLHARPDLFADAVHPNAEGAGIIAKTVYEAVSGNYGGLQLSEGFGSHMVLPQQEEFSITGKANRGERVTLDFGSRQFHAMASGDGEWSIELPAHKAGGPYVLRFSTSEKSITMSDVYFGELWLCSGQSNMDFPVERAAEASQALTDSDVPIRLLHYQNLAPTDDIAWSPDVLRKVNDLQYFSGDWQALTPAAVDQFSAVGYFFALHLYQALKIPIGIVQVSVGGSGTESWIPRKVLDDDPDLVDMMAGWLNSDYLMPWVRQRAKENLAIAKDPLQQHPYEPSYNFEAGIAPLLHLPIKGVIWYQGESNTNNVELYAHMFPVLVASWRHAWGRNLPFYFVQISGMDRPSWPRFRDMQRQLAARTTNSGMVVSSDLGEAENVHYADKKPVGDRMAELVLQRVYHLRGAFGESPLALSATREPNAIRVVFADTDGLLKTSDGRAARGFEVRDRKGRWSEVAAHIKGNAVLLATGNPAIDAVAYAWKPYPEANLVNRAGLPASTFLLHLR